MAERTCVPMLLRYYHTRTGYLRPTSHQPASAFLDGQTVNHRQATVLLSATRISIRRHRRWFSFMPKGAFVT